MDIRESGRDLAAVAALLADPTRAAICLALLDGRSWSAGELARHTGVAPSTATGHLHLLVAAGLLAEQRQGRHRYVALAGPDVADVVETLAALAPQSPRPTPRSLRSARTSRALARGRTCYDHLAGELGIGITDALARRGLLDDRGGLALTPDGRAFLTGLGIDLPVTRRPAVRSCLDLTERRPHLAGAVGAALCRHAFDEGWITRIDSTRAVAVTEVGAREFRRHLGLETASARTAA
ncbi:ArsR/SmtB family transcription factor [Streptomyces qinzhouensis]|uniref:Winged helix-turn-helix transcriptional regulator n=1 Tax=Streptomyces qinzhouensis TaxID=2599401 RepID=A0A5B8IIB2_9ACTN|nr:winged helix-turn-helix domain-containing protein [Streptomyces qinzhouensis]QDY77109.1 winged helix-turn-helix transcriptional regulator [Streptomyces qinzhouensis]